MTEAEYRALWVEGQDLVKAIIGDLNKALPHSIKGATADGLPGYRTVYAYNEIAVALALLSRKISKGEGE